MNCLFARLCTIVTLLVLVQNVFGQAFVTDPTFQSLPFKSNSGLIYSMIVQPDNKVLLTGEVNFINGSDLPFSPFRLNEDGSLDNTFKVSANGWSSMLLRADGKIIVTTLTGESFVKLGVLKSNGQLDSVFETPLKSTYGPQGLAVTKDNKILLGTLNFLDGSFVGTINRINKNGVVDNTFNVGDLKISWLQKVYVQSDQKLLLDGDFQYPAGPIKHIIRLNSDGSLDNTFNAAVSNLSAMIVQQDGKILIGSGSPLIRLNTDGSQDNTFNSSLSGIEALALQTDGKILCSQWIEDKTNYISGHYKVIRLGTNGVEDNSFISGDGATDRPILSLGIQSTGQVLAAGAFSLYNGQLSPCMIKLNGHDGSVDATFKTKFQSNGFIETILLDDDKLFVSGNFDVVNDQSKACVARLNLDGSLDNTFNVGTGVDGFWDVNGGVVSTLRIQDDKKILIGGRFKSFNGKPANGLIRLNSDGSTDETFTYSMTGDYTIHAIALQADHNIVVGEYNISTLLSALKRLKPDGSVDPSFKTGTGLNNTIMGALVQPDGKILVAGYFTNYNSVATGHIVRLNSDGTIDNTFNAPNLKNITKIVLQNDGKILAINEFIGSGGVLIRLKSDGSLDELFTTNFNSNAQISDVAIRDDDSILLSGYFGGNTPEYKHFVILNADGSLKTDSSLLDPYHFYFDVIQVGTKIVANAGSKLIMFSSSELVLGIDEVQTAKFYPNPATDVFHLELQSHLKDASIQFFDAKGKAVNTTMKTTDMGYEVDTHLLPRGLYLIRLLSKDSEIRRKIILE